MITAHCFLPELLVRIIRPIIHIHIYIYEATGLLLEQETVFTIKNSNVHIETPHKTNVLISGAVIIQTGRT